MKRKHIELLKDSCFEDYQPGLSDYSIFDAEVPNLALRIQPNGAKSWVVRKTFNNKTVRITIGRADEINIMEARIAAESFQGEYPKSKGEGSIIFKDLFAIYDTRKISKFKPSTQRTTRSRIRAKMIPTFGHVSIIDIRPAQVTEWFSNISRKYPGGANELLDLLKRILNTAIQWGYLPGNYFNPCTRVKKNHSNDIGQAINEEGLKRLGVVLTRLHQTMEDTVDIVCLLLYTGCRFGEIRSLEWSCVEPDRLVLPDAKKRPRNVPLGDPAQCLLNRRRGSKVSVFVFPSKLKINKPRADINYAWKRIREEAQLDPTLRVHDLRHTFASRSLIGGETLFTTSKLLGHSSIESTLRYTHLQDNHLSEAADRIAYRISKWLAIPEILSM